MNYLARAALVDIGARDLHASERLDLHDLILQRMAVIEQLGNRADAENELTAVGACVGDGDGGFHAEFVARARLSFGNASYSGACRA